MIHSTLGDTSLWGKALIVTVCISGNWILSKSLRNKYDKVESLGVALRCFLYFMLKMFRDLKLRKTQHSPMLGWLRQVV